MNEAQSIFGTPAERPVKKVRNYMIPWVTEFISNAPFMVMASANSEGNCDASPKGGKPGFVKVLDEKSLVIPDVAGNKLFQSFENIETNSRVGLIFFIPGFNGTARVNGGVQVLRKGEPQFDKLSLEVFSPDENAKLLQALLVTVDEAYAHCPRALAFSKLWNTEQIDINQASSPLKGLDPIGES